MLGLIIFSVSSVIECFFIYRLTLSYLRKSNPFAVYFLGTFIVYLIGELIGLVLIIMQLRIGHGDYLYWVDVASRFTMIMGSVFMIQIPLYLYFPKSKKRLLGSALAFVVALSVLLYDLSLRYLPTMDASGAISWNTPLSLSIAFTVAFFLTWAFAAVVFFIEYIKSRYQSTNALFLSIGFALAGLGNGLQDFAHSDTQTYFLYFLLLIGMVLIVIGFSSRSKTTKK